MKKVEDMKGFKGVKECKIAIYQLQKDHVEENTGLGDYTFDSKWLKIESDGKITVTKGYCWDGCTPKIVVCGVLLIGIYDGILDKITKIPKTYYASLIHDILYQYYGYHGIPKSKIDKLFLDMLRKQSFKYSLKYYIAVKLLGGFFFDKTYTLKYKKKKNSSPSKPLIYKYYKDFFQMNKLYILREIIR